MQYPGEPLDTTSRCSNYVEMKNITVSVDDEIYHRARIRAAEQKTSVSAMVRCMLQDVAAEETVFERLKRLEDETVACLSTRSFVAGKRLDRDTLHDRDALS